MSQGTVDKDVRETLALTLNWSRWLKNRGFAQPSRIIASAWAKDPLTSTITIDTHGFDSEKATVRVSSGDAELTEVDLVNTVTTSDGETSVATITVRMVKR